MKIAYIYRKGYRDFVARFLAFWWTFPHPAFATLNSVLRLIFLPQMQIQWCICKTYHFVTRLKKMKMTYSNRNHRWTISQIQMKLLSSADKFEHCFFRFILASKFSFFLSFFLSFFNGINCSKQDTRHTCHYKKKSEGGM